jgi:hypothetical protein
MMVFFAGVASLWFLTRFTWTYCCLQSESEVFVFGIGSML